MAISELPSKNKNRDSQFLSKNDCSHGYLSCLEKTIDRIQYLLTQEEALRDYEAIHSAKSILYAAIERAGTRAERLLTIQRMLRELLSIVTSQYQSPGQDRKVGLQILDELKKRLPFSF